MFEIFTKSGKQTEKVGGFLAREITRSRAGPSAAVVSLEGELGSGKTAFARGFARGMGIKGKIKSPTFVLFKIYRTGRKSEAARRKFFRLVHVDCYRLENSERLFRLGFKELCADKNAVILLEWADKFKKFLPRGAVRIKFKHGAKIGERVLIFFSSRKR